jgi:HlyD family secretion protein
VSQFWFDKRCIPAHRRRVLFIEQALHGISMSSSQPMTVAALRRLAVPVTDARPDEDLLRKFCAERDEAVFGVIVRRHGGLVLDVCRSVLRNEADAEDAFQATFVTLAVDARRVHSPPALAGWLHAVAFRVAAKARRARERRRALEAGVLAQPPAPAVDPSWAEVRQAIHEEVNRLPDRYRAAIVLYYLAGRTQDEVGSALGLSTAGAKKRLERGRAMLHSALVRRGFGPTASLAATAIALPGAATALAGSAAELAVRFVVNHGTLPAAVRSLVSSGVQPMFAKIAIGAVVLLGTATTVGIGMSRGGPPDPENRGDEPAVLAQAKQKSTTTGAGAETPKRGFSPSTPELENFRGLDPAERLKLIEKRAGAKPPFAATTRGDLAVTVIERGSIESANNVDVVCKVKAKDKDGIATTIKWVIDEGTLVKKGDVLVRLDDAAIKEQFETATAKVREAEAALILTTDNLRLLQEGNEIEIRLAEIDVKLAILDLKDAPSEKAKEVLELKVEQAKLKLERVRFRAKAQQVQGEGERRARAATVELESRHRSKLENELQQCVLQAPSDGMVVYYKSPSNQFGGPRVEIVADERVREGQKLVRVVDLKKLVIATRVHESVISTFRAGQAAQITIDAFPGKKLQGKVTQISPVASAAEWAARGIKVYPVTIAIDEAPPGLKPSMTGEVQVVTGERKAVLQVPIKALLGAGKEQHCFVKVGQELVERRVVSGVANANVVEILEGLQEGDQVVVDPAAILRQW